MRKIYNDAKNKGDKIKLIINAHRKNPSTGLNFSNLISKINSSPVSRIRNR